MPSDAQVNANCDKKKNFPEFPSVLVKSPSFLEPSSYTRKYVDICLVDCYDPEGQ